MERRIDVLERRVGSLRLPHRKPKLVFFSEQYGGVDVEQPWLASVVAGDEWVMVWAGDTTGAATTRIDAEAASSGWLQLTVTDEVVWSSPQISEPWTGTVDIPAGETVVLWARTDGEGDMRVDMGGPIPVTRATATRVPRPGEQWIWAARDPESPWTSEPGHSP